jgi:hypothetical protein
MYRPSRLKLTATLSALYVDYGPRLDWLYKIASIRSWNPF